MPTCHCIQNILIYNQIFRFFLGFYTDLIKRTCEPCDLQCKSCVVGNPSACTSCKDDFFLKEQSCVSRSECRSLYYVNINTGRCNFCPSQCTYCDSVNYCTECFLSYYLTPDNNCVDKCPKGTFPTASQRLVMYFNTSVQKLSEILCIRKLKCSYFMLKIL